MKEKYKVEIWDSEEFILKEIFLIVVGGIFGLFCIVFDIIDVGIFEVVGI